MDIPAEDLSRVLELYGQGLYLQAHHRALAHGPLRAWTGTAARLAAGRLARQLGAPKLSRWQMIKAYRGQPTHPEAIYYHARYFLEKHNLLAAWRFLRREEDAVHDAAPDLRADLYSLHAFITARLRDFQQSEVWLTKALELAPDRPWLHVERAACLEFAEKFDEALEVARHALKLRPFFRPAVQAAGHLLLVLERDREALDLLIEASAAIECGAVLSQLAALQDDLAMHADASRSYDRFAELSPLMETEIAQWLAARRSDIAYDLGDVETAHRLAKEAGEGFHQSVAEKLAHAPPDAKRVALERVERLLRPHPQNVPATLAMLRRAWTPEEPLPSDEVFRMDAPLEFAERRWAEQGEWVVREFTATAPALFALLDAGVPVALGVVEATYAQLQAIVGYDQRKGILLFRDPSERHLGEMMLDPLLERFRSTGPRGLIMLPPAEAHRLNGIDLPDAELYDALYRIHRAMERHDRDAAGRELDQLQKAAPDHRLTLHASYVLARYDANSVEQLAAIDRLLARFPDDPTLLLARVGCLRDLDRRDERLALLRRLSAQANADLIFAQQYAQELVPDAREHPTAERLLRRVIQNRPFLAAPYFFLANLLWDQQRQDESLELYRFAACLDDSSDALSRTYFRSARAADRTEEAQQFLEDRVARFGDKSSQPARILFNALSDLDKTDEAFAVLDHALARRKTDGELMLFTSEMRAAFGEMKTAQSLLKAAKDKVRPTAWLRSAAHLEGLQGNLHEALAHWRAVAAAEPLALDAHRAIALRLAETEGRTAALRYLEDLSDRHPRHYGILQLHIEWLRNEGAAAVEPIVRLLIASHPADAWARRELALHLAELKRYDEATAELDAAARLEPPSPSYHCVRGRVLSLAGRSADAREAYRAALKLSVDNDLAISELMQLCPGREERRDELAFVEDELTRQPHFGDGILAFHGHAMHTLEPEEVHEALRKMLDDRPDLWQTWSAMIQQLVNMERFPEAEALAEQAIERFPLLPRLWLDRADLCAARQDFDGQVDALRQALKISPGWGPAVRELSEALDRDKQLEEACALLQQAVARAPLDPINRGQYAEKLWKIGQSEAAVEQLREALLLDPGYDWAWRTLGDWLGRLDQPEKLLEFARDLTKRRPGDPRTWLALVRVLTAPAHTDEVLAALDRVLTLSPRNAEARDLKAERLSDLGRFDEAAAACARAPGEDEAPLILRGRAAWVEQRRGSVDEAISAMERLTEREPDYYWAWQQLAEWYSEADRPEDYLKAAEHLVRLRPDSPMAVARLGEAKIQTGDREGGKADLRQAQQMAPDYPFPGMLLFDEYMSDDELAAASATLAILQEHVADDFVMARQCHLAARKDEQSQALDAFRNLCESPIEATWPITSALTALRQAGWSDEADAVLKESIQSRIFHPYAALLWLDGPGAEDVPPPERLDILNHVIERHPRFLQVHDRKAELLARLERYDEALEACKPAGFDEVPVLLQGRAAWIEYQRGKRDKAISQMAALVERERDYFWGWQQLAGWYETAEQYDQFLHAAEQMVRLSPRDPMSYGFRGEAHLKTGDRAAAKDDFFEAFGLDPDYTFAGLQLFDAQLDDDELDEAAATLIALQERTGEDGHIRLRGLKLAIRRKDRAEAAELLEGFTTDDESPPYLFQQAIEAMTETGWTAAVDDVLDVAVEDEASIPLVGRLWMQRHAERDDPKVEEKLDELLERGEIGEEALIARLEALARKKDTAGLFSFIEKYREELREDTTGWGKAGWALAHVGAFKATADWLADWRDREDASSWMLINLAIAHRARGDDTEAHKVSEFALKNSEPDYTTLFHTVWLTFDDALARRTDEAARRASEIARDRTKLDSYFKVVFALAEALVKVQKEGRAQFPAAREALERTARDNSGLEADPAIYRAWRQGVAKLAREAFGVTAWLWARRSAKNPPLPPLPPGVGD